MDAARIAELLAGWLAALITATVMALTWQAGLIFPTSVAPDLIGAGVIAGLIAVGVTIDSVTGSPAGLILLALGTVLLAGFAVISFVTLFLLAAALAIAATLIAFTRRLPAPRPRQSH